MPNITCIGPGPHTPADGVLGQASKAGTGLCESCRPTVTLTAAETNDLTLRQQALQAMAVNRTYIGRASPTAAQNTAQTKALSQQMNGLIRLVLGQLDGTD